ncbi:hypothetical protein ACIBG4_39690 [Nonomuraea sp. NPDC050383]|uniref:hypothetical protein n=1 Tax=Nonomuraea sp. NPDC050383 TaxID=3364362 RepID=UPI0037BD5199
MQRIIDRQVVMTGSVVGGPDIDTDVEAAIRDITLRLQELQGQVRALFLVNVIYQVGGEFLAPEFAGVRTGRFSNGVLIVQAAVPEGSYDDAFGFLGLLLVDAVDAVVVWAARRKDVQVSISDLRSVAQAVQRR